jgi:hypothetical protein
MENTGCPYTFIGPWYEWSYIGAGCGGAACPNALAASANTMSAPTIAFMTHLVRNTPYFIQYHNVTEKESPFAT